ncbi:MAG: CBS domain-containing protein, partial [Candidatus Electrothrix sp. AR3]|nr:CBS domain-containing protein [Candidatus Electrothrix sp. AR3]
MEEHMISAIVLVEEDHVLVGIITERDIARHAAQDRLLSYMTGGSLISEEPVTAFAETGYREAFQLMVVSGARHLVVVDKTEQVIGIVTATNFLHSLGLEYFVELTGISEVISRDIISLSPSDSVHRALEKMRLHEISCILIVEQNQPVGILTERDVISISQQKLDFYHTPLYKVMTQPVLTIPERSSLPDVVDILKDNSIRRLAVIDKQGDLVGLLTENDLLKGLQSKYSRLLREIITNQEQQLRKTRKVLNEQTVLHSLLESAPDTGIAATDMNLRILYFNPVAARIYGYKPEDVIGKTVHEFHVIHQIPAEFLDNAVKTVEEKGLYEYSTRRNEQDGIHHFEMRVSAIRNPAGKMIGYMLLAQDVTRRKEIELALQQS